MKRAPSTFLFLFFLPLSAHAGFFDPPTIRVANKTSVPLYLSIYYCRHTYGMRGTDPLLLPPDNALHLTLPAPHLIRMRRLVVATTPEDLSEEYPIDLALNPAVGLFRPNDFTVMADTQSAQPCIVPTSTWIAKEYDTKPADLTLSPMPPAEETAYAAARCAYVHEQQNRFFSATLSRPLRIGVCSSGGGFRAMIATAGLLWGLEECGLLPLIDTCVGLSGATWFLFPWVLSTRPIAEHTDQLADWLWQGLIHHVSDQYRDFAHVAALKKTCGQSISGIDFYGISLAHTLIKPFKPEAVHLTMHAVAAACDPTKHPLIIGTASTRPQVHEPHTWISCTPFSLQLLDEHLYVPIDSVGARFSSLRQLNTPPPLLLCYFLGIFGSSFSISVRDVIERVPESLQALWARILPRDWHVKPWSNKRFIAATIPNPCFQAPHSAHAALPLMTLVDGGYLNNLPLEATVALRSEPYDILFVLDSKQQRLSRLRGLRAAHTAASAHHPLPALDEDAAITKTVSFHFSPESPTVLIYCTLEGSPEYDADFNPAGDPTYTTLRLLYTPTVARRLATFMRDTILRAAETIKTMLTDRAKPLFLPSAG